MTNKITNKITICPKQPAIKLEPNPPFGVQFTPHLLRMEVSLDGNNSFDAEIVPYAKEAFLPGMASLHYGQSIFEGMKAFRQPNGGVGIFRADLHAARFRKSAKRMVMAEIPEEIFVNCLTAFAGIESENVPSFPGHSLYLRPLLFATDSKIKMGASQKYLFYIMGSTAGTYFGGNGQMKKARVLVNRAFVRAYPGGLGEVKTAANYAAGIWPQRIGQQFDCDQVLYLDAVHRDFVDELGGMNVFFVAGKELWTPELNGCILPGVTRRSILDIAKSLDLIPIEKKISFTDIAQQIKAGLVTEAFACGTAAVVSPIGEFLFQEKIGDQPQKFKLPDPNPVALKVLETLQDIQRGNRAAPGNWLTLCE